MEFTTSQANAINFLLPGGFHMEACSKRETRPRRSEVEYLETDKKYENIGKRVSRERKQFAYKPIPEPVKRPGGETNRKVYNLLRQLKNHPKSLPFLQPVDTILYPEYLSVISDPIDLETIENRLNVGYYKNTSDLGMDIRRIWGNSYQYNAQNPDMYQATIEMSQFFELNFRTMENLPLHDTKIDTVSDLKKKVEKMNATIETLKSRPPPTKKPSVTMQDRRMLCADIQQLNEMYLAGVLEVVRDHMSLKNMMVKTDDVEIDVATLPVKVVLDLNRYVQHCLRRQRMIERYEKHLDEQSIAQHQPMVEEEQHQLMPDDHDVPMFWNPYMDIGVTEFEDINPY